MKQGIRTLIRRVPVNCSQIIYTCCLLVDSQQLLASKSLSDIKIRMILTLVSIMYYTINMYLVYIYSHTHVDSSVALQTIINPTWPGKGNPD